jgi:heme o synthase
MSIGNKIKVYMDFTKFRLASLVILSALSGYLFVGASDGLEITYLLVGGFLVTAASNGSNQIWERELDVLMNRTGKRPLPTGNMSVNEGIIVVVLCLLPGLWMLYQLNLASMVLGLFAFISYVFIYTPMKRISTWAVFVGAFPGAIPPMLGAVAGSDSFGLIPGVLFLVQFVWQFSHFWAIAWVLYEDYLQGGFSLLPSKEGPNKTSAFQIAVYSFALIPFSLLPWLLDWTGITTAVVAGVLTTLYYLLSLRLLKSLEKKDAKRLMFASFIILPILQFLYVLDRNPETIEAALKAVF